MSGLMNITGSNMTNASIAHPEFKLPLDVQVGITFFAVLIFVTALIGNTIVVYIVCSCNHMRNTTNILIANMAIADLWITIDVPYVVKWLFVGSTWFGGSFGVFLCKFCHSAQAGSVACSVFTLVCISLDRSFAIIFPMKVILTRKIVRFMILAVWLATIAITIPLFLTSDVHQTPDGVHHCNEQGWENLPAHAQPLFITIYTVSTYICPLGLILIMYVTTGFKLWARKIPGQRSMRTYKKIQSSTRRATIMLVTVVVVFAVCWFPFQIREIILVFDPTMDEKIPIRLLFLLPWFGFSNSAINPILYVVFSENYRREFRRTFTSISRRRRRRSSTSVSRGTTFRTRMSLSTGVPLQKLRNDSTLPNDVPNGLMKDAFEERDQSRDCSDLSNKGPVVLSYSVDSDPPELFESIERQSDLIKEIDH